MDAVEGAASRDEVQKHQLYKNSVDSIYSDSGSLARVSAGTNNSTAKGLKRNWKPYNEFDRYYYENHKRRPTFQEAKHWFEENKETFLLCNNSIPSWEELKVHRTRYLRFLSLLLCARIHLAGSCGFTV